MSSQSNSVIAGRTIVDVEPFKTHREVEVDLGGIIEFRNHFRDCSDFEIVFDEPGPPDPNDELTGTMDDPIVVHMPYADAVFHYYILFKEKDGTCRHRKGVFKARSCPGCLGNQ